MMHTGYDNSYWMCNRQETLLNLPNNDSLRHGVSLDSYKRVQDGRQTSHLNGYVSAQSNITDTNQNFFNNPQRATVSQCVWTSAACPRPNRPCNNYPNGGNTVQQKPPHYYWQNLGQRHIAPRNDALKLLNKKINNSNNNYNNNNNNNSINNNYNNTIGQKSQLLEIQNKNSSTTPAPRIRVRDVNSLNNIAQNVVAQNTVADSSTQQRHFDYFNINHRHESQAQNSNVEHANYIPSLFEVNPFQSPVQIPTTTLPSSTGQERLSCAYQKQRDQFLQDSRQNYSDIRRNEPSSGRNTSMQNTNSLLHELLGYKEGQLDSIRPPDAPQSVRNERLGLPPKTTEACDLLNASYGLAPASYRNPPSYTESLRKIIEPPRMSQESRLPVFEHVSPPLIENSIDQPIRVTAVISLPDLADIALSNSSVPNNQEGNFPSLTESTNEVPEYQEPEISNRASPSVVSSDNSNNSDGSLNVKKEPLSESLNDGNQMEIVIQTLKTEIFHDLDEGECQNSEQISNNTDTAPNNSINSSSNHTNNNGNGNDKNPNVDKTRDNPVNQTPVEKKTAKAETTKPPAKSSLDGKESESQVTLPNYKSQINRDKLDRLIEFLNDDNKNQNHVGAKSHPQKPNKQKPVDIKKSKIKKKSKTDNKTVQKEDPVAKENSEPPKKSKISETDSQKTNKDFTQTEKCQNEDDHSLTKQGEVEAQPTGDLKDNEKMRDNQSLEVLVTELRIPSEILSTVSVEELQKDFDQAQKDTEGKNKTSFARIFPNFNYHFCGHCNLVSPIEWFWINAVSGELKCLHCFKRMSLPPVEGVHKLSFGDGKISETIGNKDAGAETIHLPSAKNTRCNPEKQTNHKILNRSSRMSCDSPDDKRKQSRQNTVKEESNREKRKSVEENRKEKRRKSVDKGKKPQEQTSETCTNVSRRHSISECSKTEKSKAKTLSKDGNQSPKIPLSPKIEERHRKTSSDQTKKSSPKYEACEVVRQTDGPSDGAKKRLNSKVDNWPRKIRVLDSLVEDKRPESYFQKFTNFVEKLKKAKEGNDEKPKEADEEESKRRKISLKEKAIHGKSPSGREKNHSDDKKSNPKENGCHKSVNVSPEQERASKPLKEKQVLDYVKQHEEKKKSGEKETPKSVKEEGERKRREEGEKKNTAIKRPLQYKDFVLNRSLESFPDVTKDLSLKKIRKDADVTKKNVKLSGKDDDKPTNLFDKLDKRTKKLSVNLLKGT